MEKAFKIIIGLFLVCTLYSCYEDQGNYNYNWISSVVSSNIDQKYIFTYGDTMRITPNLSYITNSTGEMALVDSVDTQNNVYEYSWVAKRYDRDLEMIVIDTLSLKKDLEYVVALAPETYFMEYAVRNVTQDLSWITKFSLTVTLSAPEGWLILEDNGGYADLSIYARQGFTAKMKMVTNVLAESGIPQSALKGPRSVFSTYQTQVGKGVWLMTDNFTGYLDVKAGHKWTPRQTAYNHLAEDGEESFVFTRMLNVMYYTVFGFTNNELRVARYPGMLYTGDLVNNQFEISPYLATIGTEHNMTQVLGFDNTNKCFKILNLNGNFNWGDADSNFPKGYDLDYMDIVGESNAQKICCLLSDKEAGKVYQVTATSTSNVDQKLTHISSSEKFVNAEQRIYHKFSFLPYYLYDGVLYTNRMAFDDQEVQFFVQVKNDEDDDNTDEDEDKEEDKETIMEQMNLEGRITYIGSQFFPDLHLSDNAYRRIYMDLIIVATELEDGSGRVYFFTPKSSNAQQLLLYDSVETKNKVVSIYYQLPSI
ncbi:MAG: PKD-like family lipoprotein [Marinifilaceae bacterium]